MEKEKVILTVSFGTSYRDTREKTIGAIERQIASAFPGWDVQRAFTSGMVIRSILKKEGLHIDDVPAALEKLAAAGISELVIQPTHLMAGKEYEKMLAQIEPFRGRIGQIPLKSAFFVLEDRFGIYLKRFILTYERFEKSVEFFRALVIGNEITFVIRISVYIVVVSGYIIVAAFLAHLGHHGYVFPVEVFCRHLIAFAVHIEILSSEQVNAQKNCIKWDEGGCFIYLSGNVSLITEFNAHEQFDLRAGQAAPCLKCFVVFV